MSNQKIRFKYHPDNKKSEQEKIICNRQMMVINAAYKVLKDPIARAKYDEKRRLSKAAVKPGDTRSSGYRVDPGPGADRRYSRHVSPESADEAPVESLADIVSDMLAEVMSPDGRRGLFEDFVSFLEGSSDKHQVLLIYLDTRTRNSPRSGVGLRSFAEANCS